MHLDNADFTAGLIMAYNGCPQRNDLVYGAQRCLYMRVPDKSNVSIVKHMTGESWTQACRSVLFIMPNGIIAWV